jgi:class 3 adenylate cyclase
MKRRSSRPAVKTGRRKKAPKRQNGPKVVRRRTATATPEREVERLRRELSETLLQQTASSDVLRLISGSHTDLTRVFETILANATQLCDANFGNLALYEGDAFRVVALHNAPPAFVELRRREPVTRAGPLMRIAVTKQPIHISDLSSQHPSFKRDDADSAAFSALTGVRTVILVPMLKEQELVGTIGVYRRQVAPFSVKQIELLQSFATQAVIAIENTRLLNELRRRTDDLTESLEQQTATSEVLRIISSSPGDLERVFEAMLQNSVRICDAGFGQMFLWEGDNVRLVAAVGVPTVLVEFDKQRGTFQPSPGGGLDGVMRTKQVVHIADLLSEHASYPPTRLGGARSYIAVPMLKENKLVGAIAIYRQEVRPFTDKQIELVKNFAAQAVIAIENARLLDDLNKLNQQLERRVTDQVNEIERMGRLRRFLPPQVADLIVASGTEKQLESHRREITALFCDLRGFTGFSESSDPEDVMALLREYHAAIGGIINKYGGTLERYAGDGVMVVFNDPIPVDNPAFQAVLMAIDMRAAIGELIEKWRKLGHDIGFGIGIAHGFATLGTIGFEGRFDYAAIGTVSNVASRLCDEAKPGQILISPRVLMAVEKDITVEPVGDFVLKGIRRPLTAYNVLASKAAN